ncbi:ABC transporter ATP-binding protein [Dethiosulfatarculus sandiegensis]|uniref:Amino acid ABC transporter ATPase n=1 Tax=Dethiosulfatarculus sandiegensis TaxID=1429043 RepID=A0A0D2HUN6_9BACT|nr:ABC transporter ATP-binding protein [Dethiosulfatarculus sandiegensis]KIX14148.1 amino acid ABC transporter ATPase [Dethiosulfatarculus sandiegensis]
MLLELKNIKTNYGNIRALKGISLNVDQGEIVCLIGANGAGKSTTLMTISGVLTPIEGDVLYQGRSIVDDTPDKIVQAGISQVPEGRMIFPLLTVKENLEMGAYLRKDKAEVQKDLERVYGLFPILKQRLKQQGGTLSGGEQQMLAIGRALMGRPKLLILDEPSLGLAPIVVGAIFEIIKTIAERGTTILLVEQNAQLALEFSDRGYVLETGLITLADSSQALSQNEEVRKAYLGE